MNQFKVASSTSTKPIQSDFKYSTIAIYINNWLFQLMHCRTSHQSSPGFRRAIFALFFDFWNVGCERVYRPCFYPAVWSGTLNANCMEDEKQSIQDSIEDQVWTYTIHDTTLTLVGSKMLVHLASFQSFNRYCTLFEN